MSTLLDAEIVNVLILAAVLEADLGTHRKIAMLLTRTAGLVIRSRAVSAAGTAVLPSPDHMLV